MTSYYNSVQHSSNVSEVSSTSPSPATSCNATAPGNAQRFGTVVPNRVFVGGIASNTTELELQELFAQYGNVKEINIINDREGICKGYGFVTFETEEEAKRVQLEPDTIVLKERRLNIGPAVIKQQPFSRPYDMSQQGGTLMYHNGTPYTYQHGMAYFPASSSTTQPSYSVGAGRENLYSAPFGPGQTTSSPAYPSLMFPAYAQPVPYLTPGQQYQFPLPFDYFKALGQTPSQFIYAAHNPMNGSLPSALNGATSQSPSPSYGQQPTAGPPSVQGVQQNPAANHGSAFYHAGSELYYNGNAQLLYHMEPSSAPSEDWRPESRQAGTPVVSLLKLHEAGSVEELEITRSPKKPGPGGPRPRSRRPGRGRSASSSYFPSTPNSYLHRSSSLSPSGQVSPVYIGGRQHPGQQHQGIPHPQGQPLYHQRRGGNPIRSSGPRNSSVMTRSSSSHYNYSGPRMHSATHFVGFNTAQKVSSSSKIVGSTADLMNGAKVPRSASASPPVGAMKLDKKIVDKGGSGDAQDVVHHFPMTPPDTPLSQATSDLGGQSSNGKASSDAICQKMQALAV